MYPLQRYTIFRNPKKNNLEVLKDTWVKPVSQSCAVAKNKKILAGHWTIKLGRQNGRLLHWPKCSCVSTKTKLWKLLLRPAICGSKFDCPVAGQNCSLQLLRMIVKLEYYAEHTFQRQSMFVLL